MSVTKTVINKALHGLLTLTVILIIRYASAINQRLKRLRKKSWFFGTEKKDPFRFVRAESESVSTADSESPTIQNTGALKLLQLNDSYRDACAKIGFNLVSLGDYLASLRPAPVPLNVSHEDLPAWIQNEIEAAIAAALINSLGPILGAAMLPGLGAFSKSIEKASTTKAAVGIASKYVTSRAAAKKVTKDRAQGNDAGALPFTLADMSALMELHLKSKQAAATTNRDDTTADEGTPASATAPTLTSLEYMRIGEIGYDPSFDTSFLSQGANIDGEKNPESLIPNPFIPSKHWHRAIAGMEEKLKLQQINTNKQEKPIVQVEEKLGKSSQLPLHNSRVEYNSHDKSLPAPTPVNERMLPDLYLGFGDAVCTHSKREIVMNRLLSNILNRLASNFAFGSDKGDGTSTEAPFVIQMSENSKKLTKPSEFVQALIQSGHTISVVPRSCITTFGVGLCVKEKDGKFSNIPLAFFLQSGYEDEDGTPALCAMPHGGINMDVRGPLVGTDEKTGISNNCNIQHYMAIEGMCGWHSDHNASVPWLKGVETCQPFQGKNAVSAVRMCTLSAVMTNKIGTQMNLPFGGYGLTGVCNDNAALVEHAMTGTTNVYPLTGIGRFLTHCVRQGRHICNGLEKQPDMKEEVKGMNRLIGALLQLSTDTNALPSGALNACDRILGYTPHGLPFQLMVESQEVINRVKSEIEMNTRACTGFR